MLKIMKQKFGTKIFVLFVVVLVALLPAVLVACGGEDPPATTPDPMTPATPPTPPVDNERGGTLTVAIPADIQNPNPWANLGPASSTFNNSISGNRYAGLYGLSDTKFQFYPTIATDYPPEFEREGDFWTATIELEDDVNWSDGEKLDAEDYVFTIETAKAFDLSGNWATVIPDAWYERAEVVEGQNAIKFYVNALNEDGEVQMPGLLIWQFGILASPIFAEHYWAPRLEEIEPATCGDEDTECQEDRRNALYALDIEGEPIVGPVNFVEWREGSFIGLERNENSYLQNSEVTLFADGTVQEQVQGTTERFLEGTQPGAASDIDLNFEREFDIDEAIFRVIQPNAAVLALQEGEIDYFLNPSGLPTGLRSQVENREGISTFENPSNGFRYLTYNFGRAPFNDEVFRQALALLIDRDLLARSVFGGAVLSIYTVVPEGNGFWYNPDVLQLGRKYDAGNGTGLDGQGDVMLDSDGIPVSLTRQERMEAVIALLEGAGYSWETRPTWDETARRIIAGEGLMKPDGTPITQRERLLRDGTTETIDEPFELLSPSAGYDTFRSTAALLIEQWLAEMGIPTNARLRGFNEILQIFDPTTDDGAFPLRDYDMFMLGWGLGTYPGFLTSFFSEAQNRVGGFNRSGYVSEDYEVLVTQFEQAQTFEDAQEAAFRMQEILAEELPYITMFTTPIFEAYRSDNLTFDYTDVLDGVQDLFSDPGGPLSRASVN